ncbi:MAG: H(+)-transporting V0 sector ATPase subunit d [Chaenotheca gracillima]|nr:MAG: H(+)-transporting V0 sector ATPase subunit d [Chaenotheca gracillima]
MTEPEDLDEDLFADLYDGDEIPAKPSQQTTAPEELETSPPAAPPTNFELQSFGTAQSSVNGSQRLDQFTGGDNAQHHVNGNNNLQANDASWEDPQSNQPGGANGDAEAHGPGIKEDG